MNINYRKLLPSDSKQYREVRLESLKAHPENFGANYEEQKSLPKLKLEEAIEHPVDEIFVIGAFDQEELIGICGFLPFVPKAILDLTNAGLIIQMYVRPTHRGRKIGLNLTKITVQEAFRVSDFERIVLGVREENISAISVYEQAGFETLEMDNFNGDANSSEFRIMIIQRKIEPRSLNDF